MYEKYVIKKNQEVPVTKYVTLKFRGFKVG